MNNAIFKLNQPPKTEHFVTNDLAYNYRLSQGAYITDYYFYGTPEKIYAFATIMYQGLTGGFMHYHIADIHHAYFGEKYPALMKANSHIHYIYTALPYRKKGYASTLLSYILQDMLVQGFQYVWLRCEIKPKLYYENGF